MSEPDFSSLDLAELRRSLAEVCQQVAQRQGRVEIKHPETGQTCVLISKAELESLERALQILSDSETVREMCASLGRLAHLSHDHYCTA